MDKITRKLEGFLPARGDNKIRSMADRCIAELEACTSDDARLDTAGKYLDWIVRRGKEGDLKKIAAAALTIAEGTSDNVRLAGYMAALEGIAASPENGDTDRMLISMCTDALERSGDSPGAARAAKPFFRLIAEGSRNDQVKSLAGAVSNLDEYDWGPAQAQCCRSALAAMNTPLTAPLEQVLITVGKNAIDEIKKSKERCEGPEGQISRAFLKEVGKVTQDPRMKSLAGVAEHQNLRDDGADNASIEAFNALNGTAGQTTTEALVDAATKAMSSASTPDKKGGAPWPFIGEIGRASDDPLVRDLARSMPASRSEFHSSAETASVVATAVLGAIAHPQAGPVEILLTALAKKLMDDVKTEDRYSFYQNSEPTSVARMFMKGLAKVSSHEGVKNIAEAASQLQNSYYGGANQAGYQGALDAIAENLTGSAETMLLKAASKALGAQGDLQCKADAARPFLAQLAKMSADEHVKHIAHAASTMRPTYDHYEEVLCYIAAVDALSKGVKGQPENVLAQVALEAMRERPEIPDSLSGKGKSDAARPYLTELAAITEDPLKKSLAGIVNSDEKSSFREAQYREILGTILNPPSSSMEEALSSTAQQCLKQSVYTITDYASLGKAFLKEIAGTTKDQDVKSIAEAAIGAGRGYYSLYGDFNAASSHKVTFEEIPKIKQGSKEPLEGRLASLSLRAMKEWDQVKAAPDTIAQGKGEIAHSYLARIGEMTHDEGIKSIAGLAGLLERCRLHEGQAFVYERALEAISHYKGESPDTVFLGIMRELAACGDLSSADKGDALSPLMKGLATCAGEPATRAIAAAISEYTSYVSDDCRQASLIAACEAILKPHEGMEIHELLARTGLDAMRRKALYPAESGIPFLSAISQRATDEELKKLIAPYLRGSASLRSDEAEPAMKRIFESIIELCETARHLSRPESTEGKGEIVVEDDYVSIGGIKLDRSTKEEAAMNLLSVAHTWYRGTAS
jgi:hypothetical protein